MTPTELRTLRTDLPDCELVLYMDLTSGTVLGSDGAVRYPQEHLDALCRAAAMAFAAYDRAGSKTADHALFFGPTGGRAFFRAPDADDEALGCVCAAHTDTEGLIRKVQAALGARKDASNE